MALPLSSAPLSSAHQRFNIEDAERKLKTLEQQIGTIATPIVERAGGTKFNYGGDIFDRSGNLHGKKIENAEFKDLARQITELSGQIARAQAASGATLSSPFPSISGSSGQGPGLGAAGGSLLGGAAPAPSAHPSPPSGFPSSRPTAPLASLGAHQSTGSPWYLSPSRDSLPEGSTGPRRTNLTTAASSMPSAYEAASHASDHHTRDEFMEETSLYPTSPQPSRFPARYPQTQMPFAAAAAPDVRERAAHPHVAAPDSSAINYVDLTNTQFLKEKLRNLEEALEYIKYHKERIGKSDGILWRALTFFPRALSRDNTPTTEQTLSLMESNIKEIKQDIEDIKAMILMNAAEKADRVKALILQQECVEIENTIKDKNITIGGKQVIPNALPYFTLHELREGKKDDTNLEKQTTDLEKHHNYLTKYMEAIRVLSS